MSLVPMTLGVRFKYVRRKHWITQHEMSKLIGVRRGTVHYFEKYSKCTYKTFFCLLKFKPFAEEVKLFIDDYTFVDIRKAKPWFGKEKTMPEDE